MCTCVMALRVLLADESSTIKKVMQLALQDFGVEVKAVPIGVDVVQVAKSFKPDIIFADVLLAKMNGYEVSKSVKADSMLKHIPVVLMWSSFMELDEPKARESKAEQRLEKPFDAETLRSMVRDLVPTTQDNVISQFLTFPDLPNIIEAEKPAARAAGKANIPAEPPVEPEDNVVMDLDEPEEFQAVPLPKTPAPKSKPVASSKPQTPIKDDWSHQDLSRYKIDLHAVDAANEDQFRYDDDDLTKSSIALSSGLDEISLDQIGEQEEFKKPAPKARPQSTPASAGTPVNKSRPAATASSQAVLSNTIDTQHAEEILRQEARKVLETIAWKLLPDVVERVVREELQKLLKDAERL